MNAIVETLNTAGRAFVDFAVPMLIQSSLLILILLAIDAVLRKRVRAVFRYWIWMLVLIKLVLPPSLWSPVSVGTWFGDKLEVSATALLISQEPPAIADFLSRPQPMFVEPPLSNPAISSPTEPTPEPMTDGGPTSLDRPPALSLNWQGLTLLIWIAVVTALLLLLAQRTFFVQGLVAQADEANRAMLNELDQCRQRVGLRRPISLRLSPNAASPAVCGLLRPVILIPQNLASRLHGAELQAVLFHELAHVKRGDLWVNLVQTLLQIIYFYNPLLWLANAAIRRIREKAVDETVLVAMGESAPQYPETLVNVAKLAFTHRPTLSLRLIGVVESKSALTSRIKHILNRPIPKTARLGALGLATVALVAAVLLPMARGKDIVASLRAGQEQIMVVRWMAVLQDNVAERILSDAQPVASKSKSYQAVRLGSNDLLANVRDCMSSNQVLYLVEDLKWVQPSPKYLRADSWSYSTNLNHPVYVGCTTGGAGPYKLDVRATEAKLDLQSESVNCDLNPGVRAEGSIFFKGSLLPGQTLVFAAPLQKDGQTVATHLVVWQAVRVPQAAVQRFGSIRNLAQWIVDGPSLLIAQATMPLPELSAHKYYRAGEPIRLYVDGKITSWKSDTDDILRKGGWPRAFLRIDDKEYACLPVFGPFESAGRTLDIPEELQMNPANFHLPLGRHTAVYGWRDVNVIDPNDPGQPVRFAQLVTNPVQFEIVEQLPADYYRPVYQEGWEDILRRNIQTPFTDAPEKHGVAGPLLTLRVRPLPFDVAFEIYTQAEGSEQRQYAAQVPIKAGSTSDYITGCSRNVEGLNWDTVGDRRWRLILVPSEKVAAWNPPIHEFYGREFTTDWVSFERSPQFEQNRLSLMRFQNDEAHSGDAVKADKPVAEAATKRRIYLPDLKTPGPNTVLDLGTGEPLSAKPMDQNPGYLDKLGKGDIAYEYVGGKSALLCFRGTRILSVSAPPSSNRGTRKISAPDVEQSGFVVYFIVPRGRYLIQTAEGNRYELNVLEVSWGVRGGALVEFTKADAGGGALDKLTKEESTEEAGLAPHGVNIYLLADESIDLKTARAKPLSELVLRKEPWIASADIERYDLSTHAIYLKNSKPLPFERVSLAGNPFVVTADGQRCYLGSLWTNISSLLPEPGTPVIDVSFNTPLPPDVVGIEPPHVPWRPGPAAPDVCQDPRIVQALTANGQLHAGLEINLDRVEVLPREGGSSLRYTYTLRNKDTDDLYVFDPDKMSPWLFHYFNVPFLLSMRDHKGFQANTSLLEPPAKVPDQLDMAWLSLLKSTASMTRTVTVPAFRYIPPDRYICSFRFGSPGRLATKDKRERTDGRIWVGQIGASMSLDTGPGEKTASTLELRIAPKQDELGSGVAEEYRKALAEGRTPAGSRYLWAPVRPGTNLSPLVVTQTHEWYDTVVAVYEYETPQGAVTASYQTLTANASEGYFEKFMGHKIEWPEIYFGQKWDEGIAGQYSLPGLPYILLVNPEGKIVATWLRGEKLTQTIKDAIDKTN